MKTKSPQSVFIYQDDYNWLHEQMRDYGISIADLIHFAIVSVQECTNDDEEDC